MPVPPLTVTVTMVDCAFVMVDGDGDTVTVGVVGGVEVAVYISAGAGYKTIPSPPAARTLPLCSNVAVKTAR